MFLLPITALSMAGEKGRRPPGPGARQLSTCGVNTTDGEAESETWHGTVLWRCMGLVEGCKVGGRRRGRGARPPVCPLIPFWLLLLTLHYLQVLSGWRRELLSVSIYGGVCVCVCICTLCAHMTNANWL